jgi:hypothetical protein
MAGISIDIDSSRAMARFGPSGIPMRARENLRALIPPLTRQIGAAVDAKLGKLKSRDRLQTKIEMVENTREIYGRVRVVWTGESEKSFIPVVLESGAAPHVIEAKNARALAFFWPRVGKQVFFKSVNHPGFPGIHYMHDTFAEMEDEIRARLNSGMRQRLAA